MVTYPASYFYGEDPFGDDDDGCDPYDMDDEPYGPDDDYDDDRFTMPMQFGPRRRRQPSYNFHPRYRSFGPYYDQYGNWGMRDYKNMGNRHQIINECCGHGGGGDKEKDKKKDSDKKKDPHFHPGSSNKKQFFLVRPRGKKGEWKGFCEHMPAKTHSAMASNLFWYLFT